MHKQAWTGILFLLFGLGVLFHQIGVWDFEYVFRIWWPLILMVIGIVQLSNRTHSSSVVFGLMLIIIGGIFLFNQWIGVNLTAYIWPLIFIFIGLIIIFSRFKHEQGLDSEHAIEAFSLFSGANIRSQSDNFQGGSVTAIFGGSEIDLRDTIISDTGATIDLTAVFGGISIIAPENVRIEITGLPIFGGWEDNTRRLAKSHETLPIIKLNCLTICGGVEIKD